MASDNYLLNIQIKVQNDKSLQTLTTNLNKAAKATPQVSRRLKQVSTDTRRFGNVAQNVGFQVQDMAVQIQGGVDPMRAMSQQIPQMLVGFGAWGAAIGVVTALMPTLITMMGDATKSSKTLEKQLEDLAKETDALGDTVSRLDMDGWIRSFNKMDQQARILARTLLEVRIEAAKLNFQQALESFTSFADALLPAGRLADIQLQSMAKNLGLSVGALEQLMPLVMEFRENPFGDTENLQKMVDLIKTAGVNAEPLLNRLNQLKAAQDSIQVSESVSVRVEGADTGLVRMNSELKEIEVTAKRVTKTFEPMTEELRRVMQELSTPLDEDNNSLVGRMDLAAEAATLFGQSFETMLNGVLMGTQSLKDGVTDMVKVMLAQLAKLAAFQFIADSFAGTTIGTAAASLLPSAKGNAFANGNVIPFARGGVVTGPTVFPLSRGAGLMGEKGAEAIIPLSRAANGNLGVSAAPVNVTINNNAPGVAVQQRRTDGGLTIDIVMQQVSNAIRKGGNDISNSLEDTYRVGRGQGVY